MATATGSSSDLPNLTPLERHAAFFDPEGTGTISMGQTYAGMKRLGVPLWLRILLTPVINGFLGPLTNFPSLRIRVSNVAGGKHPWDSGTFDDAGGFDATAFEAIFAGGVDCVTAAEMNAVVTGRGNRRTSMGAIAGLLGHWFSQREIAVLFRVAADTTKTVAGREVPAMSRRRLAAFYDGSLFEELARAAAASSK